MKASTNRPAHITHGLSLAGIREVTTRMSRLQLDARHDVNGRMATASARARRVVTAAVAPAIDVLARTAQFAGNS